MLAQELSCEMSELRINASSSEAVVLVVVRSFKMKDPPPPPLFVFLICAQVDILVMGGFSGREEARGCIGLRAGYRVVMLLNSTHSFSAKGRK